MTWVGHALSIHMHPRACHSEHLQTKRAARRFSWDSSYLSHVCVRLEAVNRVLTHTLKHPCGRTCDERTCISSADVMHLFQGVHVGLLALHLVFGLHMA